MKKRLIIVVMMLTLVVGYFLNYAKPTKYLAGDGGADDREIEWNSYGEGKLV